MTDTPFGPYIRQFLGRQVRVTLDDQNPSAVVTGTLMHATDDGEVTVRDAAGINHYAWPGLHIELLEPEALNQEASELLTAASEAEAQR